MFYAGWDHRLMTEARTVAASPPKVLTGAVHLRALEVDDWVVEQQLSRDPEGSEDFRARLRRSSTHCCRRRVDVVPPPRPLDY